MIWILPWGIMGLWLVGGQLEKGARRFGVPGLALVAGLWEKWKEAPKKRMKLLVFVILIPILSMGYGVNSWLMGIFKKDWIVRFVYGIMLSVPLGIYTTLTPQNTMIHYFIITGLLVAAFQLRAGSLGKIGKYDILVEDIVRSLTLGYSITWLIR